MKSRIRPPRKRKNLPPWPPKELELPDDIDAIESGRPQPSIVEDSGQPEKANQRCQSVSNQG
ncbi:MAG: hypothetical protein JXB10_18335 [Pirellulales bacterium]|nr:hypothetical protein [Pirellulales bacterium]